MKEKLPNLNSLILAEKKVRKQLHSYLSRNPELSLHCYRWGNKWKYYSFKNRNLTYLGKDKESLIRELEYKCYFKELAKAVDQNLVILEQLKELCSQYRDAIEVFKSIPEQKRHLIKPYKYQSSKIRELREEYGPDSLYDKQALVKDYYGTRNRSTKSGYLVRSKAEEDIADAAWERGLFFIYEKDLVLKTPNGPVTVHPDFAFYNTITDSFVYLEHLGKIDDPEYAVKNLPRLIDYMENGFVIGKNLFITAEGATRIFTKREIKKVLDAIEEQL